MQLINFEDKSIDIISEDILNLFNELDCKNCKFLPEQLLKMSSVPYTSFSANTFNFCNCKKENKKNGFSNPRGSLRPDRYSTKFMKSVWGLYNRYAPHSYQKNNEAAGIVQQAASVMSVFAMEHSKLRNTDDVGMNNTQ